jgi:hypothetical protein
MNYDFWILIVLIFILIFNILNYLETKQYDNNTGVEQSKLYLLKKKIRRS